MNKTHTVVVEFYDVNFKFLYFIFKCTIISDLKFRSHAKNG